MVSKMNEVVVRPGLKGVIAADTKLSSIDGRSGELIIAGYRLEEFASSATFEDVVYLLWRGKLGNEQKLRSFGAGLSAKRRLPEATVSLLAEIAAEKRPVIEALRMAAATLDLGTGTLPTQESALVILARIPTLITTYWNLRSGKPVIEPSEELSHVGNYLYMLTGQKPADARVRALETYFNAVVDHGLNASTFAARVIIATESDLVSALTGAIGALKGPLHGGAPGPALNMVVEIGAAENAEAYLRAKLEKGERLMGFGHRVYKVRDPRAMVLADAAERLFDEVGDRQMYELAKSVESTATRLLAEYKPGRMLHTNVEFYTALLLDGIGLGVELFTPTFAAARAAGWIAHCIEQSASGGLIRPQSRYVGERLLPWTPVNER